MRRILSWLGIFFLVFCCGNVPLRAAVVFHSWNGTAGTNTIDVDDQGGSFNNNSDNCTAGNPANNTYRFDLAGVTITSTLELYLFNGSAVDDGADRDDDGIVGSTCTGTTGEDFSGTSGLSLFDPFTGLPPLTQVTALSDSPLQPFTFHGKQTGLDVQQLTYVEDGKDFAIFEYRVVNNTTSAVPVKIGLGHDMDIADSFGDDQDEVDTSVPVVLEHDTAVNADNNFYAGGVALAGGKFDNFRLGACCDITLEAIPAGSLILDAHRLAYFNARPNEACDDGNKVNNGDGCSNNCKVTTGSEVCGNGIVEPGEGCDDGNTNSGDGCDANCLSEKCGDGTLDPGEECDDGNLNDGDGCSSYCTIEFGASGPFCGDGIVNDGAVGVQQTQPGDNEVDISADLGVLQPGQSATAAFCITGGISAVDGATANNNAIAAAKDCIALYQSTIAVCGNGIQNAGEQCDDGNTVNGDGCESNCTLPVCGNGIVDAGETCDDGNTANGDGCSSTCQVETAPPTGAAINGSGCSLNAGASPIDAGALMFMVSVLAMSALYLRKRA